MKASAEPLDLDALPLALSVKTTAQLTDTSTDAIYDSIAAGLCPWPVLRIGRVIRIPRAAVLASIGVADPRADGAGCGHGSET